MSRQPMFYDEEGNTFLPGYGRPLKDCTSYYKDAEPFPNALNPSHLNGGLACGRPFTLRELRMLHIMDGLTDKSDWEKKIQDKKITSKWRDEILASGEDVSPKMIDYIFKELKYKAKVFSKTGVITVFDDGVVKSDTIVPPEFAAALMEAVKPLQDVSDDQKDWHPGSNKKVLDLVHPSLFPLVYGVSRILPQGRMSVEEGLERSGGGIVVTVPQENSRPVPRDHTFRRVFSRGRDPFNVDRIYSKKFQWLPCEVNIRGEKSRITSYINNLHPKRHKDLYDLVEQLIDYAIPLWDMVLTPLQDPHSVIERIEYMKVKYERSLEDIPTSEGPQRQDEEDEYDHYDRRHEWFKTILVYTQPEPKVFMIPKETNPACIRKEYKEYGLQVIVKLANIELTPEEPEYEGGSWHVEGQMNEHIVATALYYYSNENITTSKLAFRQQFDSSLIADIHYEQDDHGWLGDIFGLENEGYGVQVLGGVKTNEGRLLAFPNIFQHQVQPFKLVDPTKPGHRKIVALFLVDPTLKVISTANVPCQRNDWWQEQLEKEKSLWKLPPELRDHVVNEVDFPMGMERAKELRLELMEERKSFAVDHNLDLFEVPDLFSLCEH